MTQYQLFATTPKAMEGILASEIEALGGRNVQQKMAGVAFQGDLALAYKSCLWLRTANRILLLLASFEVKSQQDLYDGVMKINWFEHLSPDGSLAVSFSSKNNPAINNTHFGALKVKDAIVDQMRNKFNKRPNIDTERPDIRVNVYLHNETAQLSLDLSGESLHKRGYRDVNIAAPIKENLAAAILLRCAWPKLAAQGATLLDPMCGSGTLLLEGAMMATDYAPGLLRDYYGFLGWKKHDTEIWRQLLAEARQRRDAGLKKAPVIVGFDQDRRTIASAIQHAGNAGLQDCIHLEKRDIAAAAAAESWPKGLIVCNPPYGERLGDEAETSELYRRFGAVLKSRFAGWQAAMIISNPELGFRLGIRSKKPITLFNGALECKLLRFEIEESNFFEPKAKSQQERIEQISRRSQSALDNTAEMFANRLRKNRKKLAKWLAQNHIDCYRLYDADLPEYAVAVDVYRGEKIWVNVQEYESPKSIDPQKANQRLAGVMAEIPKVLEIPADQVFLKIRRKQKNTEQYEKHGDSGRFHEVAEGGCRFWVNFEDYLDTGLFLDHRPMRLLIRQLAKGKRFLNLFAYTGSATVHAVAGGAVSSLSIDMSKTYLEWAKRNFDLNGINSDHKLLRANCLQWLADQAAGKGNKPQFDLIFLDPPTFSNSKKMDEAFDIQNDHVQLLQNAAALLAEDGILFFSTNFRRFKLHRDSLQGLNIEEISSKTIDEDFGRDAKIHYCWRISR